MVSYRRYTLATLLATIAPASTLALAQGEGKLDAEAIGQAAAVDGDFIMTAEEVQPVLRALRKSGIHIVALHNHMVGERPAFYFTHFWGKGSAKELAQGVKAALDAQARTSKGTTEHR